MGSVLGMFCKRVVPVLVLALALLVGWVAQHELPLGVVFACVIPMSGGYLPPPIFGAFKEPATAAVPSELKPAARPKGEILISLPGGAKMPANGLGMCCRPGAYDHESAKRQVLWFLLQGGRHVDTAALYLNHRAVGEGIAEAVARGVPRSEIFLVTKVFPDKYGYALAKGEVEKYLAELGVDYIDLILLHAPAPMIPFVQPKGCKGLSAKECRAATWKGLSEQVKAGKVRNIGVSNFNARQMEELRQLKLEPIANNQFQYNPFAPAWKHSMVQYCKENGIAITAWSSLAGTTLQTGKALTVETLQNLAKKSNVTVAQLLLRWALQKDLIVIPGTSNPKHMKDNLKAYDFQISAQDMATIDALGDDPIAKEFMYGPEDQS